MPKTRGRKPTEYQAFKDGVLVSQGAAKVLAERLGVKHKSLLDAARYAIPLHGFIFRKVYTEQEIEEARDKGEAPLSDAGKSLLENMRRRAYYEREGERWQA